MKSLRYFAIGLSAAIVVTELAQPATSMDINFTLFPKDFNEVLTLVPISLVALFHHTRQRKTGAEERKGWGVAILGTG